MPIYEYECNNCLKVTEQLILHGVALDDDTKCPYCLKEGTLNRILSSTNHQLIGEGFYKPSLTKKKRTT